MRNKCFTAKKIKLLKLTDFIVMLSRKAKHLALAIGNHISSWARFFASLRYAQNDKLLYVFANKGLMIISAIVLVSLRKLNRKNQISKPQCKMKNELFAF